MIARVAIVLVLLAAPVAAHQAPSGWTYPHWCCGQGDCAALPRGSVRAGPAGWVVTINPGEHPMVRLGSPPQRLVVPYAHDKAEVSPDADFHICLFPTAEVVRCFWAPGSGM